MAEYGARVRGRRKPHIEASNQDESMKLTATEITKEATAPRRKAFFPFLVLGIGIALSKLLHFVIRDNIEGEAQLRFERQASDAKHVIEARIHSYAEVITGLRAMSAPTSVSRTEFH